MALMRVAPKEVMLADQREVMLVVWLAGMMGLMLALPLVVQMVALKVVQMEVM